jgi:hypothetical protein
MGPPLDTSLNAAGKSPLRNMNLFIYANLGVLNDIMMGNNPGCNTNGFPVCACVVSFSYVGINIVISRPRPVGIQ